ncbi:hypothetical protein LOK49_LG06G01606 [Camellia lanceoleosa]|uniref:Uncharacterized protein n=1 Tax=Camellia lanceoleosa TaxID=1840588 RepID=A0ACC0HC27_9ERIC|nr:hypothetical protein LOK49_LG06G01606 [Camellia lanceoleosa]
MRHRPSAIVVRPLATIPHRRPPSICHSSSVTTRSMSMSSTNASMDNMHEVRFENRNCRCGRKAMVKISQSTDNPNCLYFNVDSSSQDIVVAVEMLNNQKPENQVSDCSTSQQLQQYPVKRSLHSIGNFSSYADVVADTVGDAKDNALIVKVQEYGNKWLYGSLVVKLKPCCLVSDFKQEVFNKCGIEVQIREFGGRSVILTFDSAEVMRSKSKDLEHWVHDWCESITQWNKDIIFEHAREVWLSFYGVPLHLWNSVNFKNIGMMWGDVIKIDRDTLDMSSLCCGKIRKATKVLDCINQVITLDCKGKLYQIRVCEEQIVVMQKPSNSNSLLQNDSSVSINKRVEHCVDNGVTLREDDDDVALGDDLAREKSLGVDMCTASQNKEADLAVKDSLLDISAIQETTSGLGMLSNGGPCLRKEALLSDYNRFSNDGNGHVVTSGFLKSLSGPDSFRHNVNLEVFIGPVQLDNPNLIRSQPTHGLTELGLVRTIDPINSGLNNSSIQFPLSQPEEVKCKNSRLEAKVSKAKEVGDSYQPAKKNSRTASRRVKAMAIGGNRIKKGVLLRAATQALSDSISLSSSSTKGRHLLNEAQATLQAGKLLGLNCEGKEIEVIKKIMDLENQDLVRKDQLDVAKQS